VQHLLPDSPVFQVILVVPEFPVLRDRKESLVFQVCLAILAQPALLVFKAQPARMVLTQWHQKVI
tara:strand:+ start:388 stop:582 length:195 start_codon:yes stop_codon:yes gene_type:complete